MAVYSSTRSIPGVVLTLSGYNVSPYAVKVPAVLRYKGVPFEERVVHPLEHGQIVRRSRQNAIPIIIAADGTVVADSTRILAYLDVRRPARRALLVVEGFDEGLARTVLPVRWMIAANARRTAARFRAAYAPGLVGDVRMALVSARLRLDDRRRCGSRALGAPPAATLSTRLGDVLDLVDAALAESGWLAAGTTSVADFALYGWLVLLVGLGGWDAVPSRQRVARLMQALGEPSQRAAGAGDDAQAPSLAGGPGRAQRANEPSPSP